jgi:hypothetical protein
MGSPPRELRLCIGYVKAVKGTQRQQQELVVLVPDRVDHAATITQILLHEQTVDRVSCGQEVYLRSNLFLQKRSHSTNLLCTVAIGAFV